EPTYESYSFLRVQPVSHDLYGQAGGEGTTFTGIVPYLQTQVNLITTDTVLTPVLASPEVRDLSFIKNSDDSRAELRKNLEVKIVKDAYLIRVALELANGHEAATIVNEVLRRYLAYYGDFKQKENSQLRTSLSAQRDRIQNELKVRQA